MTSIAAFAHYKLDVKVITWNIAHRNNDRAFRHAIEIEQADLVLFQECFHPQTYLTRQELLHSPNHHLWEPTHNGWGNLIVTKQAVISDVAIEHDFKGRLLIATASFADLGELTVINLHTPITDGYSWHNLKKMLHMVSGQVRKGNTIICGDLNFGVCFDKDGQTEHKELFDSLLQEHDMIDCHRKFNAKIGQTFRPARKSDSQICIDYILVSKNLESRVKSCHILDDEKTIKMMSDHNPLVAILE